MPHPYFDRPLFLFDGPGQALYDMLCIAVPQPARIEQLFVTVWGDAAGFPRPDPFTAELAWREILVRTSLARRLPKLCDTLLANDDLSGLHDCVRAVQNAPDPVHEMRLRGDKLFLDRVILRSALANMSADKPVLVVRASDRGSGKSWTRELIKASFNPPDDIVYVGSQLNYSLKELIIRLMKKIDPTAEVPESLTTESASHREIIIEMLARAEARKPPAQLWIIIDDVNDVDAGDPLRPRLGHCDSIRSFMESFVLEMEDSVGFGKYFRIVLIDYPDRDLRHWPDVWVEDRPDPTQFTPDLIGNFLADSLSRSGKFLDPVEASRRGQEIMQKAAAVSAQERIRTIMSEVRNHITSLAA
jgi:hypothetical protein